MRKIIRQIKRTCPIEDIEIVSLGLIFYYYLSVRQEEFYDKLQGISEEQQAYLTNDSKFENNYDKDIELEELQAQESEISAYAQLTDEKAKEFEQQSIAELGYFILPSRLLNYHKVKSSNTHTQENHEESFNLSTLENLKNAFQEFYDSITNENTKRLLENVFTFVLTTLKQNYVDDNTLSNLITLLAKHLPYIFKEYQKTSFRPFDSFKRYFAKQTVDSVHYYNRDRHQYRVSEEFNKFLYKLALGDKKSVESIYDMTCYSGNMLSYTVKHLGVKKVQRICGQEYDTTMYDLCRMNLFVQQIPSEKLDIRCGNFVTTPAFGTEGSEKFDVIFHNMPYEIPIDINLNFDSQKTTRHIPQDTQVSKLRELIIPEALAHSKTKLSSFVYIFHALKHLAEHGTAVILCNSQFLSTLKEDNPVLHYLLGITEGHNGYIDTIALFNKSKMAVLVLKKNRPTSQIFFATDYKHYNGWSEFANICLERQNYADDLYVARVVDWEELSKNKFSLSPNTYLTPPDVREEFDVKQIQANIEQERKKQDNIRTRINDFFKELNESKKD